MATGVAEVVEAEAEVVEAVLEVVPKERDHSRRKSGV